MLPPRGYRIFQGETIALAVVSSVAAVVQGRFRVEYDDGTIDRFNIDRFTSGSARAIEIFNSKTVAKGTGTIISGSLNPFTSLKRGQFYYQMLVGQNMDEVSSDPRQALGQGYLYDMSPAVLGWFEEAGSGPGYPGYLDWVQEGNDVAGNVTTTVSLGVANARRIVRQILIKYHSSGDAATRTLTLTLRDIGDTSGPTGFSISQDTWVSATVTLTVNEEGIIHVAEHGFVSYNDAGTITYADNSSAPNPFPLTVEEGETADLIIAAGSGNANDDYDVWVQYEEWVEV